MRRRKLEAGFEEFEGHRSLVLHWRPPHPPRAQVVFVPAFGDEMNQTRRMVKLAAEALATEGFASCVFDLFGTGDSSADFAEASVERWLADCRMVVERLRPDQPGDGAPLVLIGCRLGCALAAQLSHMLPAPAAALVGWAPVLQGRAQLSAMLRANQIWRMQRSLEAGSEPRALWSGGQTAMLGGYPVSPKLAEQLEALDPAAAPNVHAVTLIDVRLSAADGTVQPSELLRKRAASWTEQGVPALAEAVSGPAFWNVADLVDVSELVSATVTAVRRSCHEAVA